MKIEQVQPAEERPYRFTLPSEAKNRWWEREQQLVTQRRLLERLRYKQYVRNGTLGTWMQRSGDFLRSPRGVRLLLWMVYLYALRRFWMAGR